MKQKQKGSLCSVYLPIDLDELVGFELLKHIHVSPQELELSMQG